MILTLMSVAAAHPFNSNEYSYRTAVKVSDKGAVLLVVLEQPIQTVMTELDLENVEGGKAAQRRRIDRYNEQVWEQMGQSLTVTLDGQELDGAWRAIEHEMNGKAAEGFFVYMVGYDSKALASLPQGGFELAVDNEGLPGVEMVYSGGASAVDPWTITSSTSTELLGDKAALGLSDPARWTRDAGMRHFVVRAERSSAAE
jgi:hypothetical protein